MKYLPSIILTAGYFYFGIFGSAPFLGLMLGLFAVWSFVQAKS